jgi:hypothetical protein
MSERKSAADSHGKAGNIRSADKPKQARPWTEEEMAAAKPLPLPTVDPTVAAGSASVPNAGKGQTKPAGRPEKDEASQ